MDLLKVSSRFHTRATRNEAVRKLNACLFGDKFSLKFELERFRNSLLNNMENDLLSFCSFFGRSAFASRFLLVFQLN